ncbi:unnamed protein product [Symbiodinium sp. KB8]|nr:unnamed protein product [Symbiodinium sp. KB8]
MRSLIVALAASAVAVRAYDNNAPYSKLPPMGWSSWVALGPGADHPVFDFCDEGSVRRAIDAFVSDDLGLYAAGYRHFHLDDCWANHERTPAGDLIPDTTNFPNGLTPVIDYAHSKGLAFGLYTSGGIFTCVGLRPGSEGHWSQDADSFASWGVDWVKMDWCNHGFEDPKTTYPLMSKALNASKRHIHFNMCEWGDENPWEWGDPIAQSWRMHGDHVGTWESTAEVIAASAAIPRQYSGRPYGWNDMDMLETGNGLRAAHANGKESNMTDDEWRTEFSMWAISASPLVVTTPIMNCTNESPHPANYCNVSLVQQESLSPCIEGYSFGCNLNGSMWTSEGCRGEFTCNGYSTLCDQDGSGQHLCECGNVTKCVPYITPLQREILLNTEVIAVNQDVTPQGAPVTPGDLSIWARNLTGGDIAVALYNPQAAAVNMTVSFAALGWTTGATVSVRDLWKHADMGYFKGSYGPVSVPTHATVMLRLTQHS